MTAARALLVALAAATAFAQTLPGSDVQLSAAATLVKEGKHGSKLYSLQNQGSMYEDPVYVLELHGTAYQQGYDAGLLFGKEFEENYDNLMTGLLGNEWWEPAVAKIVGEFLRWQWRDWLSKQVPEEYFEELRGLTDGAYAAGVKSDVGDLSAQGIVLANFPGDLKNLKYLFRDEWMHRDDAKEVLDLLLKHNPNGGYGMQCSMFGVWGSRTDTGDIYTGRNLDWVKQTGVAKYKLLTVHHPENGHAHVTVGFAGLWGALAGMSAAGLTVHEANLEADQITFRGFPWVLRLRHVMAYASNIVEARKIFADTNNTVGFNHMVGSSRDRNAMAFETMQHHTAYFLANDPREANLEENGVKIGAPLKEALWRTNHGYGHYIVKHAADSTTHAYENSKVRYNAFHDGFVWYEQEGLKMDYTDAINMTAIVGKKNDEMYVCQPPYDKGSNVLSVTFDPAKLVLYSAWENGKDATWTPAACNTYVKVDMTPFFN